MSEASPRARVEIIEGRRRALIAGSWARLAGGERWAPQGGTALFVPTSSSSSRTRRSSASTFGSHSTTHRRHTLSCEDAFRNRPFASRVAVVSCDLTRVAMGECVIEFGRGGGVSSGRPFLPWSDPPATVDAAHARLSPPQRSPRAYRVRTHQRVLPLDRPTHQRTRSVSPRPSQCPLTRRVPSLPALRRLDGRSFLTQRSLFGQQP